MKKVSIINFGKAKTEHEAFHFKNGKKAHTLDEMREAVSSLSSEEYKHHCNDHKNDFANWVEHVVNENELAIRMRTCPNKEALLDELDQEIARHKMTTIASVQSKGSKKEEEPDPIKEILEKDSPKSAKPSGPHFDPDDLEEEPLNDAPSKTFGDPGNLETKVEDDEPEPTLHQAPIPKPQHTVHEHHHEFLVKEFFYGFLVGIILAIILMKMISII